MYSIGQSWVHKMSNIKIQSYYSVRYCPTGFNSAAEIFSCLPKIHTPPFKVYHCSWLTAVALQTFPAAFVFQCGHKTRIHQCNASRSDSCHCPRLFKRQDSPLSFLFCQLYAEDSKTQGHGREQDGKNLYPDHSRRKP